jgi:protein-tyrosine phosphatase
LGSNKQISSILFVCLGNICRSPLAEAIARDIINKHNLNIKVDSAGTGSWHIGETPCENSQKVALENSLDITNYKARQVTKKDFKEFDLIVGLDHKNIANLKKIGCVNPLLLGDFGFEGDDVPDPYFFDGFEGFTTVYSMIETCVNQLFQEYTLIK